MVRKSVPSALLYLQDSHQKIEESDFVKTEIYPALCFRGSRPACRLFINRRR
jgi:hypothetical protein